MKFIVARDLDVRRPPIVTLCVLCSEDPRWCGDPTK
jgi:hypothetical protein